MLLNHTWHALCICNHQGSRKKEILTGLNSTKVTNTKKMNILMMTNTFTPHVGGVARSVQAFTNEYRNRGHRVLVIAPEYENMPEKENGLINRLHLQMII